MDTYEKKYKEALEWARKVMQGKVGFVLDEVLEKFPELKKSEDAKIRKVISDILLIDSDEIREILDANNVLMQNIDAWLEKQAEKKPVDKIDSSKIKKDPNPYWTLAPEYQLANKQKIADKVGSKFKIGDLITNGILVGKIDEIHELGYHAYFGDHYADVPDAENWHKWTIQDANDGDVLVSNDASYIVLFKGLSYLEDDIDRFKSYCHCREGIFSPIEDPSWCCNAFHPATKKQRDTLFAKMKEAGYEWSEETHELKEIDNEEIDGEDYGIDSLWHAQRILEKTLGEVEGYQSDDGVLEHKCAISAVKKLYEQNPVWSEEDEKKFYDVLAILRGGENCYYNSPTLIDWLKSLKDRYTWKPTEEQMDALDYYANSLCTYCDRQDDLRSLFNVLKKLKG